MLNSVNITEGIEMTKQVIQIMSSLDEDEVSYMLTKVYKKFLELKTEKKNLKLKASCPWGVLFNSIISVAIVGGLLERTHCSL